MILINGLPEIKGVIIGPSKHRIYAPNHGLIIESPIPYPSLFRIRKKAGSEMETSVPFQAAFT